MFLLIIYFRCVYVFSHAERDAVFLRIKEPKKRTKNRVFFFLALQTWRRTKRQTTNDLKTKRKAALAHIHVHIIVIMYNFMFSCHVDTLISFSCSLCFFCDPEQFTTRSIHFIYDCKWFSIRMGSTFHILIAKNAAFFPKKTRKIIKNVFVFIRDNEMKFEDAARTMRTQWKCESIAFVSALHTYIKWVSMRMECII